MPTMSASMNSCLNKCYDLAYKVIANFIAKCTLDHEDEGFYKQLAEERKNLDSSLFLNVDQTLELFDPDNTLEQAEKKVLVITIETINLATFVYNLHNGSEYPVCINNFFQSVTYSTEKLNDEEEEFYVDARTMWLVHALKKGGNKESLLEECFPTKNFKFYFVSNKVDYALINAVQAKRKSLKSQSREEIVVSQKGTQFNKELQDFSRHRFEMILAANETRKKRVAEELLNQRVKKAKKAKGADTTEKRQGIQFDDLVDTDSDSVYENANTFSPDIDEEDSEESEYSENDSYKDDSNEDNSNEDNSNEDNSNEDNSNEDNFNEDNSNEDIVYEAMVEDASVDDVKEEEFATEETSAEPVFTEEASTDPIATRIVKATLVEVTPVKFTPDVFSRVNEKPVKVTPVKETPVKETPVRETPVSEIAVKETPVKETPASEVRADETLVKEENLSEEDIQDTNIEATASDNVAQDQESTETYELNETDDEVEPPARSLSPQVPRRPSRAAPAMRHTAANNTQMITQRPVVFGAGPVPEGGQSIRRPKFKVRKVPVPWTLEEVAALETGLEYFQMPMWAEIKRKYTALKNRDSVAIKDKARNQLNKLRREGFTDFGPYKYLVRPTSDSE